MVLVGRSLLCSVRIGFLGSALRTDREQLEDSR